MEPPALLYMLFLSRCSLDLANMLLPKLPPNNNPANKREAPRPQWEFLV